MRNSYALCVCRVAVHTAQLPFKKDSAVLHAIATFGEYSFDAASEEAAATISVLASTFCREYPINQQDDEAGVPGTLFGRYPGDSYAGGNPWQLLTSVAAEVFYLGGTANVNRITERGVNEVGVAYSRNLCKC